MGRPFDEATVLRLAQKDAPVTVDLATRRFIGRRGLAESLVAALVVLLLASTSRAAEFSCAGGDVSCLVAAIHAANALNEPSTIQLGDGAYTLTSVDNETDGPNGLPSVTGSLTIRGGRVFGTSIGHGRLFTPPPIVEPPDFRLVHVAPTGRLTLEHLALLGGRTRRAESSFGGGILNNGGTLVLDQIILMSNLVIGDAAYGAAVFNNEGTVVLTSCSIGQNNVVAEGVGAGGGLATAGGRVSIVGTGIWENRVSAAAAAGAGIADVVAGPSPKAGGAAVVEIINSTIHSNTVSGDHSVVGDRSARGGGIFTTPHSEWRLDSTTIAFNVVNVTDGTPDAGAGIAANGPVSIQNTVVAQNYSPVLLWDCSGTVTSLDHNLVGDVSGCTIAQQPHDLTGDPGFMSRRKTDSRTNLPPSATSRLIDAGDPATCPPTDQLGRPRVGICDIGAAEFYSEPLGDFVTGLYGQALGRAPSATELADWLGFLQPDPTLVRARATVHAFFEGAESLSRPVTPSSYVTALYRAILGREPDPAGLQVWVRALLDGADTAVAAFVASAEFRSRLPDCRDTVAVFALVTRLYQHALGRTPAPGESAAWTSRIVTTCDVKGGVTAFLDSAEYLAVPRTLADHVTVRYRALLGREPGDGDVSGWVDYLSAQRASIEDRFVESPEFLAQQLFR